MGRSRKSRKKRNIFLGNEQHVYEVFDDRRVCKTQGDYKIFIWNLRDIIAHQQRQLIKMKKNKQPSALLVIKKLKHKVTELQRSLERVTKDYAWFLESARGQAFLEYSPEGNKTPLELGNMPRIIALERCVMLGRGMDCPIEHPDQPGMVSNAHVEIKFDTTYNQWRLRDNRSTNGTMLRRVGEEKPTPVRASVLDDGDVVVLGRRQSIYTYTFNRPAVAADSPP